MTNDIQESNELFEHFRFKADKGQSLLRIDKFLSNRIENASRTRIQSAAAAGNILVNDKPIKSSYRVKPGDVISILLPHPPRDRKIVPENIPLDIMYEDDEVMVINKNAGMVVHPGHGNYTGTLVNALMFYMKDLPLFQTGEIRPGLVHRLDKNTSGILVIAKNDLAHNKLAKQFFNRTIERKYLALVWGDLKNEEGTITGHIGRNPKDRTRMYVFPEGDAGKPGVTHYRVIERLGYLNLVECKLDTGRTHQIRVHFQFIKHPLFNDMEYGGNEILRGTTFSKYRQFVRNCFKILPRHALHATFLGFSHPGTGEWIGFESPLPEDMSTVIEKWRNYTVGRNEMEN